MGIEESSKPSSYSQDEYHEKEWQLEEKKEEKERFERRGSGEPITEPIADMKPFYFIAELIDKIKKARTVKEIRKCEQELEAMKNKAEEEALEINKSRDARLKEISLATQELINFKKDNPDEDADDYNQAEHERLENYVDHTVGYFNWFKRVRMNEEYHDEIFNAEDYKNFFEDRFKTLENSIKELNKPEAEYNTLASYTYSRYIGIEAERMSNILLKRDEYKDMFRLLPLAVKNEIHTKILKFKDSFENIITKKEFPEDDEAVINTRKAFDDIETVFTREKK
ncbi:hypothetical protein KAI92_05340 [Candidatus Parcubacteria bacterium]|nr:hypothetical protein [Candidatus Parcubacteria bacterium]